MTKTRRATPKETTVVEIRITGDDTRSPFLVNGRPATPDEFTAFWRFIEASTTQRGVSQRDHRDLSAAFGNPPHGIRVKTAGAMDWWS